MPRTLDLIDNYSDGAERTVGVAQTVTGTTVSVVPRRVTTQQTVQLTLTGMDTGASRTVNVIIEVPSGTGTINFSKITPQTNNTNLNEMYVFTLADDSFAFLHVGDYQLHLDSAMPTTVPVVFSSEVLTQGGVMDGLPDPFHGIEWGHFVTLALIDSPIDLGPFRRTTGRNQMMLSTVEGSNLYLIRFRDEFFQHPGARPPFLRIVGIEADGPIQLVTPTLRTQRLHEILPESRIMLEVNGPGMVSIIVEEPQLGEEFIPLINPRDVAPLPLRPLDPRDTRIDQRERNGRIDNPRLDAGQRDEGELDGLVR